MAIKITTLIENSLGQNHDLQNEHGLSFFIEIDGPNRQKILFDTGQSSKFISNAEKLDIDLSKTQKVVLSHSHYDHTGGLMSLVKTQKTSFDLYVGSGFFAPKYADDNGKWKFIGSNFDYEELKDKTINVQQLSNDMTILAPGVFAITNFPKTNSFEKASPRFFIHNGIEYERDYFKDEVTLVLESKAGLVVLLGCSHPGIVNILEAVQTRLNKPLYCVVGGTHLVGASEERLDESLKYLRNLKLPMLGLSHCTGDEALGRIQKEFPNSFLNNTGTILSFE